MIDLLGMVIGIAVSRLIGTDRAKIVAVFAALTFVDLLCVFNEIQRSACMNMLARLRGKGGTEFIYVCMYVCMSMCVLCLCAAPDSVVFSSLNFERSSIVLHKLFRNVDLLAQAQVQTKVQVQSQSEGAEDARGEPQSADGGADAANLTSAAVEVAAAPTTATATAVGKFSATLRRRWQSAVALLQGQRGRGQGSTGGASASDQSRVGSSSSSSSNSNSSSSFNSSLSLPAAGAGRPAWSPALNATLLGLLSPMNVSKSELLFLPATQGEGIIKTWGSLHLPVTDRNNEVGCRRGQIICCAPVDDAMLMCRGLQSLGRVLELFGGGSKVLVVFRARVLRSWWQAFAIKARINSAEILRIKDGVPGRPPPTPHTLTVS